MQKDYTAMSLKGLFKLIYIHIYWYFYLYGILIRFLIFYFYLQSKIVYNPFLLTIYFKSMLESRIMALNVCDFEILLIACTTPCNKNVWNTYFYLYYSHKFTMRTRWVIIQWLKLKRIQNAKATFWLDRKQIIWHPRVL